MKIYIANNPAALAAALEKHASTATVEAEYGDTVVPGSVLTLAHHGPRSARPCPCSLPNFPELGIEAVGISHVDLDTLGGVLALMGQKPSVPNWVRNFWATAAQVDVKGVHKLPEIGFGVYGPEMTKESLNAWWAFSETDEGRVFAPRDGSAVEVDLSKHIKVLRTLLVHDEKDGWVSPARTELVRKGQEWALAKHRLDEESLVDDLGPVLVRSAEQFTNHLYRSARAVVSFNPRSQSVTVSLADPIPGVSCREFVQNFWGPEAGGHDGIAGSPRGTEMTLVDARAAAAILAKILEKAEVYNASA